ncbi:MAG: type II toxin-antitoxin system RatA family toxin [Magnetospirillum sp.]
MGLSGRFAVDFPGLAADDLFAIASDIESYPSFIPWCRSARVLETDGNVRQVENHFGAGPMDMRFVTRAQADPPQTLAITSEDGPFRSFRLDWTFREGHVEARYHISLRSPLLQGLAAFAMPEVERRIVSQFRQRVADLHGV